ncbi:galectin-4-like [Carettochelys insculpta]|uniref:galectin-4-like n=1 Tax=Carettochelys insculpta TaxID=44489 RepID=UPI003EBB9D1C
MALLFNPCFEGSPHILFKSLKEKKWCREQREDNSPFRRGKRFTVIFIVTPNEYEVTVNEYPPYKFQHCLPPDCVRFLEVDGEVELKAVIADKKHFYEYSYRIPLQEVKYLQVTGTVKVQQIEIFKDSSCPMLL